MFHRRTVLKFAAAGLVSPAVLAARPGPVFAQAQTQTPPADATSFLPTTVTELARTLSQRPYRAPQADLPDPFNNLTYEPYVGIRSRPANAVWVTDGLPFVLEPLHRGFLFTTPMQINIVEGGTSRRLSYSPDMFEFGKLTPPAEARDIGFSGVRILGRDGDRTSEIGIFQGASFYRALARGQTLGVSARGLALRTAEPRGEEFPLFRALWIERPTPAATTIVIHALLDSESLTGAYRFTLRPGDATIVDTECTLFPRVALDHVGLGAMSGGYLFGPLDRRRDDLRPNVYEVTGLQMLTGKNEWIWRPVSNRETLQISAFIDENPQGFGFLQRERDFFDFQDDDQHWETRPSLWVEPIGEWGAGSVALVEIPADAQTNQNAIAYWRPKAPLAAGSETSFAYRQFWCWTPPNRPSHATVSNSRAGRSPGSPANARKRRFLVEFTGDILADLQRTDELSANLSVTPGTPSGLRLLLNRDTKVCRVLFDMEPGGEAFCELRLVVENKGKPVTETWLYRWTP